MNTKADQIPGKREPESDLIPQVWVNYHNLLLFVVLAQHQLGVVPENLPDILVNAFPPLPNLVAMDAIISNVERKSQALVFTECIPPIPVKLVDQIWKWEFIDLASLHIAIRAGCGVALPGSSQEMGGGSLLT